MMSNSWELVEVKSKEIQDDYKAAWAPKADVISLWWTCTGGCQNPVDKTMKSNWVIVFGHILELDNLSGDIWCESCANKKGYFYGSDGVTMPKGVPKLKNCLGCGVEVCNVCAVCHTDSCDYVNFKVTTLSAKTKYAHLTAKTQKARGYVTLATETALRVPKPYAVITSNEDVDLAVAEMHGKSQFIRPCPMRPRHGFVDSRPMQIDATGVSSVELKEILAKAIAADEQGHAELLVVPYIKSQYNAIITPTRVAVGPGNDGATSGHGSVSFPLMGVPFSEISPELLSKSKIGANEDPYIEAVMGEDQNTYFTQIRAGVKIPPMVGADYIPFPVRVEEVIDASGDLLEWEAQTKMIKRGTVVCHIGGTLISHYGVHCMQNDIPVFTSRRPEIGEALEVVNKIVKANPEAVIRGLGAGVLLSLNVLDKDREATLHVHKALISMMTILHNSAAMSGEDGYWLGVAVAIMYRAGMAASHGEARHKLGMGHKRQQIYALAFKNFFDARATLGAAQYRFLFNSWSSGYGGKAWGKCTEAIIQMDNTVRSLIKDPTEKNVAELVMSLNNAVNQAHNGGWWLNKFIGQEWFNKASVQSLESVTMGMITMFRMQELLKADTEYIPAVIEQWAEQSEIEVKSGVLQIEKETGVKYSESKPVKKTQEWESHEVNFIPKQIGYIGVYCEFCQEEYPLLSKSDIEPGNKCGHNGCDYLVGWYEDGMFSYPENVVMDGDDDIIEDEDGAPFTPIKTTNMNGHPMPSGAKVISAQAFIGITAPTGDKLQLHLQYKVDNQDGYRSCDCAVENVSYVLSKSLGGNPSYSGSDNSKYFLLEVLVQVDDKILLENTALKLDLDLNLKFNTVEQISWTAKEVKGESKTQTKEESKIDLEKFLDENPF
jgi:hypothetical protein